MKFYNNNFKDYTENRIYFHYGDFISFYKYDDRLVFSLYNEEERAYVCNIRLINITDDNFNESIKKYYLYKLFIKELVLYDY